MCGFAGFLLGNPVALMTRRGWLPAWPTPFRTGGRMTLVPGLMRRLALGSGAALPPALSQGERELEGEREQRRHLFSIPETEGVAAQSLQNNSLCEPVRINVSVPVFTSPRLS